MMNKLMMIVLCLAIGSAANAEYVKVQFEGVIDVVDGGWLQSHLNDSVYVGSSFTGTFSYNTGMQEVEPGYSHGSTFELSQSQYNFSIQIGDYVFKEESQYQIQVTDDHPTQYDSIAALMNTVVVEGPPLPPVFDEWLNAGVFFEDRTCTALNTDQLPVDFPSLSAWTHKATISLSPGPINRISGAITSLTVVPEPASLALLALGGLAVVRRR